MAFATIMRCRHSSGVFCRGKHESDTCGVEPDSSLARAGASYRLRRHSLGETGERQMNDRNRVKAPPPTEQTLNATEQALLDGKEVTPVEVDSETRPLPSWVVVPPDLQLPSGKTVGYMRFRANWTDEPARGDRQCVVWNLTVGDETLAIKRARGDGMRVLAECSKQMIRAVDGVRADWTGNGGIGNVNQFWDQIGSRCRQQISNYYLKTHTLDESEQADFFASCIDVRTI